MFSPQVPTTIMWWLSCATVEATVLLLDEVAAHLDTDRRAALYDEICALDAQSLLTGTGPELFTGLQGRAQAFAVGREAEVSRIMGI